MYDGFLIENEIDAEVNPFGLLFQSIQENQTSQYYDADKFIALTKRDKTSSFFNFSLKYTFI